MWQLTTSRYTCGIAHGNAFSHFHISVINKKAAPDLEKSKSAAASPSLQRCLCDKDAICVSNQTIWNLDPPSALSTLNLNISSHSANLFISRNESTISFTSTFDHCIATNRTFDFEAFWYHFQSPSIFHLMIFRGFHEHPLVVPHVSHLRQVPFRTMVNCLHSEQGSPS